MRTWLFAIVLAGCGGTKHVDGPIHEPTECEVIGGHVADVTATFKDPLPVSKDVVAEIVKTHCDADAWSGDAKKCFASMFDEAAAKECIGALTADQHDKVLADLEKRSGKKMQADVPTEPPPPPPPPPSDSDPCQGGE